VAFVSVFDTPSRRGVAMLMSSRPSADRFGPRSWTGLDPDPILEFCPLDTVLMRTPLPTFRSEET
jgi:hypothetical protein